MAETHPTEQPILPSNVDDPRFIAPPEDATPAAWTAADAVIEDLGDPIGAVIDGIESSVERGYRRGLLLIWVKPLLWVVAPLVTVVVQLVRLVAQFVRQIVAALARR
jgi:hypothetical protein